MTISADVDRIDISDELDALLAKLEVEKRRVARVSISPSSVTVDLFLHNEYGSPYIDRATGQAGIESVAFEVTT